MKSDSELATLFDAFAHPSRIGILRAMLPHAQSGITFGDLAKALGLSPSTLTHHLREMAEAGVIKRQMAGRSTVLRLNTETLTSAITELTQLCCCGDIETQTKEPLT